jgi:hypothetical protein
MSLPLGCLQLKVFEKGKINLKHCNIFCDGPWETQRCFGEDADGTQFRMGLQFLPSMHG